MIEIKDRKLEGKRESVSKGYEAWDIRDLIDERIKSAPDKVLYTFNDKQTGDRVEIMPAQFKEDSQAMTAWLCEQGYRRRHIAIIGDNSYAWVVAMFGILGSDNVLVAIDKGLSEEEIGELLSFSDCDIAFYAEMCAEKVEPLKDKLNLTLYKLDIRKQIEEGRKLLSGGKDEYLKLKIDTEAPAVILFTSGTTGKRKGVVLSQKTLIVNSVLDNENARFFHDVILLLPFNHCFGLNTANIPHLLSGRTIHINSGIRYLYRDLVNENPEGLLIVPAILENLYFTMWKKIKENGREEAVQKKIDENRKNPHLTLEQKREMFKEELSIFGNRLRTIYTGGAAQNVRFRDGFGDFGIEVLEGYGITECSPVITNQPSGLWKPQSVGRIIPGIEVKIDKPDANMEGEICVKGPIVMLGYYKNEEATKEAVTDGWFHTGDMGYLDSDNYLYITGRKNNLIILSNGENVSPEELETQLTENPLIKEVVVYAKDNKIAAQIFPDQEYAAQEKIDDVQGVIKDYVAECNLKNTNYKQISVVEFRETPFLRTSSQKIKRDSVE